MEKEREEKRFTPRRLHQCFGARIQSVDHPRFCENISFLIISVNELKSENVIFNQLTNEGMSDFSMFGLRVLNRIFRYVDGTGIVIVHGEMFLTNTIIKKKFLYPKELSAATTSVNVFCLSSGERRNSAFYSSMRQDCYLSKNTHWKCSYSHQHSLPSPYQNIQPTHH